jgi:catecholate siderophore receptor
MKQALSQINNMELQVLHEKTLAAGLAADSVTQETTANRRSRLLPLGAALMAVSLHAAAEQAAGGEQEKTLATVKVQANSEPQPDGMRATTTRVGKTLQDPHDVPQAVTTVTNTMMEEQQVGSLREALRNVSGLTFNAAEGGRSGDNMMLRGFYTFGDMYLDGIRDTAQYNRETFNLEQIDVLRGAASMLFGRGQAGGVINQVSKTPFLYDQNKVTASFGTDNYMEQTGDFNKVLGENMALRVNVMNRDEGSWRSNPATGTEPEIHRQGLAASFGYGLGTADEFLLSQVTTTTKDIPDYGNRFDQTTRLPNTILPAETFYGTDRNFDNSKTSISTGTYTHRFSPNSEWRTALRYADYARSYWAKTPDGQFNAPDANGVIGGNVTRTMDYETLTLQSDFNNKFNALGMGHEMLVGVEYLKEDSFRNSLYNFGGVTNLNPPNFQPYISNTNATPASFKSDSYAMYAQDTVEFVPRWKATFGARRDYMDANYSSTTSPELKYGEWSTRAALSYHPTEANHVYLSYSDSFSPTADLYQLTVAPQPAERSKVLELGNKWMLLDGDLALRAAIYRAVKDWERNTDLESTASILTKKRRTDGIELEAAGRINEQWDIFTGLALMDAEILEVAENINATTGAVTSANPALKGQRARNTPPYTFNLWTTYKLGGGWKVGGGVEAKGDRYGYQPSSAAAIPTLPGETDFHPNTAPAYERYDAMVAYEQRKWAVRLNVQNLTNKLYYDSIYDNGGFTVPGTKRKAILTGELKF